MRYFRDEYVAHMSTDVPHVCKDLLGVIDPEKCIGCALQHNCPVNAISGETRKPHVIDREKCIKCGACITACRFGAISNNERAANIMENIKKSK